ncbi:MAG: pyridoxamine 5'-phosphate oxidase [Proteobacteria bacterium]|nr:pyridoxamine 5'-phosphate oxidase [Pseudomonadota bacterium]
MAQRAETDPIAKFKGWLDEATKTEPINPNACALATTGADGQPSVRMVLLKGADERGFVFYTNLESQKAQELEANPAAALCFYWKSTARQVRVQGPVEQVSDEEADAYFATRGREAQIGAWASRQSQPMKTRFDLGKAVAKKMARFAIGKVPRPDFWSGYRLAPTVIEFWREKPFRLHERIEYRRSGAEWSVRHIFP